jgi:hypothetical protein
MITIKEVTDIEQLTLLMPLFIEGYHAMNKKKKVFEVDQDGFVKTLIGILNTFPTNNICVVFDDGVPIGYAAAFENTPTFAMKREMLLWALYVKPQYKGNVVVLLFEEAKRIGVEQGFDILTSFNSRFTGGMFRLFEGKLGMRRNRIQFNYNL